ncbi:MULTISPECIES: hypothetical protein [unclassified Cryobacterium]|uniref:hypothetical protein n=1 Tax=unclassified Cryobacterium TaxID=2649013 RepID=UPI002B229E0B|nr:MULTISPECIES: hypothetical protein [unclassified Cryobacterium]MEB0000320.1 hypothetical protein [Cryobacterium sp. RTS3]MEB0267006.1 hypothetical protein [Cryobacterium sp. 10I5]
MSAADRVIVSTLDGQLFVEVWLVEDDEFNRAQEFFEVALRDGRLEKQAASVLMSEWSVQAANTGGVQLSIMRKTSGGTGTDAQMEWTLWPLSGRLVDITIRNCGEVVWSVVAFAPAVNEHKQPISAESLGRLRPMPDSPWPSGTQ